MEKVRGTRTGERGLRELCLLAKIMSLRKGRKPFIKHMLGAISS